MSRKTIYPILFLIIIIVGIIIPKFLMYKVSPQGLANNVCEGYALRIHPYDAKAVVRKKMNVLQKIFTVEIVGKSENKIGVRPVVFSGVTLFGITIFDSVYDCYGDVVIK